jgi:hypothetical protein
MYTERLPDKFQKYFWDVAFDDLTIEKYPEFIAVRVLNYGDLDGIKWLLSWAGKDYIRKILNKNRNLNSKTRNYWQIILTEVKK